MYNIRLEFSQNELTLNSGKVDMEINDRLEKIGMFFEMINTFWGKINPNIWYSEILFRQKKN